MSMKITRRELGAMGLVAAILPTPLMAAKASRTAIRPDAWHQRVKRIMQINFTERDPERFDVEAWADYLASVKAECTFLSITNNVAFYPSAVPDLPISRWLKGRDIFGECVAAARKRGIKVVGRLSPDIARREVAEAHPDWFRRDKAGKIGFPPTGWFRGGSENPSGSAEYAPTCQFTGYFSEFLPKLIDEVMTRYGIDGIYTNGWPGSHVPKCYCEACKRIADPDTEEYRVAYQKRTGELWQLFTDRTARKHPEAIFSGNLGSAMQGGDLDQKALMEKAIWMFADNQGRTDDFLPSWDASQQTRLSAAIIGNRPAVNSTAAYEFAGKAVWRTVTGNAVEVRSRLYQTLAAGGSIHLHWLGYDQGFNEDRRWQPVGREVLRWQAENDAHFHNSASLATVGLLVSPRSNHVYKAPRGTTTMESFHGMYRALNEARIPFDLLIDSTLTASSLSRYKVLVLPNVAAMSDATAALIKAFVMQGGSLLTTFETGLYDENGKPRPDFALGSVTGVAKVGERHGFGAEPEGNQPRHPGANSMQRLEGAHPVTEGFRDTTWIQGSAWRVPVKATGKVLATDIPQHAMYPVEAVYGAIMKTEVPTIVATEQGTSRTVHLAGDIDAGYWRNSAADLGDLIMQALRWLHRDDLPVAAEGPGLIEMTAWQTEPGYAVHLVNHSNPDFRGGPMRATTMLGEQKIRLKLPAGRTIGKARLLMAGKDVTFTQNGGLVDLVVPSLNEYEVVALTI